MMDEIVLAHNYRTSTERVIFKPKTRLPIA